MFDFPTLFDEASVTHAAGNFAGPPLPYSAGASAQRSMSRE
jgi:hypothetical protein